MATVRSRSKSKTKAPVAYFAADPAQVKGAVPTRTPQTEDHYLQIALRFEDRAARMLGTIGASPREVATCAIEKKTTWARSTWRQMKAALIYRYTVINTAECRAAVEMLEAEGQEGALSHTNKTSAKRKKNVTEEDIAEILAALSTRESQYAPIAQKWLFLNALLGLRPHEWGHAESVMLSEADIHGKGNVVDKKRYLRIRNGKNTNGRAHGAYRHLDLSDLSPELIDAVGEFVLFMTLVHLNGEYSRTLKACDKILQRVNVELHGESKTKYVQLYSGRHRFAALAKKQYSQEVVSALMGHGHSATAGIHYGKLRRGGGGVSVRPLAIEVARVTTDKKTTFVAKTKAPATGSKTSAQQRGGQAEESQ